MTVARIPFTADDEGAIRQLTGAMMFLLVVNFLFGALMLLGGCLAFAGVPMNFQAHPAAGAGAVLTALAMAVYALGMIGQGAILVQARQALAAVVDTDTSDQLHLSLAFSRLKMFFLLEAVMFLMLMGMSCGGMLTQAFGPAQAAMQGFGGGL